MKCSIALAAASGRDAARNSTGMRGRPDFTVLLFPMITMQDPFAHGPLRHALIGAEPTDAMKHRRSWMEVRSHTLAASRKP